MNKKTNNILVLLKIKNIPNANSFTLITVFNGSGNMLYKQIN